MNFRGQVYSYQTDRYRISAGENINDAANQAHTPYYRNREYLISILVLSKCNALVAGGTSGSIGALFMSDSFEHCHMYQLGTYK